VSIPCSVTGGAKGNEGPTCSMSDLRVTVIPMPSSLIDTSCTQRLTYGFAAHDSVGADKVGGSVVARAKLDPDAFGTDAVLPGI